MLMFAIIYKLKNVYLRSFIRFTLLTLLF